MARSRTAEINHHTPRPLVSLNAIAFDTETTGLDTRQARIIQLGGVRVIHGKIVAEQNFQSMVNPGQSIPSSSTEIHSFVDEDVVGAGTFAEVYCKFSEWCNNSVLIGYASGFDLAILKREHRLAGLKWVPPRTLDIRFLVNIVAPNLPDFSLDTIASWLGIEIHGRHSALGDAVATAEIFIALIPLLRERGVRTLGEAERACLQFTQPLNEELQLGWHELRRPAQAEQDTIAALNRIDSYPYRHRIGDLMTTPVLWVEPTLSLAETLSLIMEKRSSAAFVRPDREHAEAGIVTERDLLRSLNRHGKAGFDLTAGSIASYPLQSVFADDFIYRAISRMKRFYLRHLGVHDADGKIVGALSARDLLRQRADAALVLGDEIDHAESAEAMAEVWGNMALVAAGLNSEGVDARDIAAVISRELCALTRHACVIAEQRMKQSGHGEAPCRYAMLVLGSGGRGESLLAMDQDNAIVYQQDDADGEHDGWFAELGKHVSDILHIAGVPYCKGGIMASNADWRQPLDSWLQTIDTWIKRQKPEDILNCDIFFDAVCVHGDIELAGRVLDHAFEKGSQSRNFIKLMSVNAAKNRSPLGLFGRFSLEEGRMDLKMGGIMSLFSCARVLAIQHGCRVLSTPQRFSAVLSKLDRMHTTFENLSEAHRIIFSCILQQQLVDLDKGISLSNKVAPEQLGASMRKQLKWALEQVPNVSNLLGDPLSSA